METVNAFDLACPKPLMMAKAKIDEGARELSVHVDNEIAVKNVSRLAEKYGLNVAVETIEGGWSVNFSEDDRSVAAAAAPAYRRGRPTPSCGCACLHASRLRICRVHWQRSRGRRRPPAWL